MSLLGSTPEANHINWFKIGIYTGLAIIFAIFMNFAPPLIVIAVGLVLFFARVIQWAVAKGR